jgi:hypothetical protein
MSGIHQILYVGDLTDGGTSLQRCRALQDLGHQVATVNTVSPAPTPPWQVFLSRVSNRLFRLGLKGFSPLDWSQASRQIVSAARAQAFDMVWIDKGLTISAEALRDVKKARPQCLIVGYSPDDMAGRHNQSGRFLRQLPLYDFFFTTKRYNVAELQALGCRRVHFTGNAFDPHTHRPVPLSPEEKHALGGPVGFVGGWERERARALRRLADSGIPVVLWGDCWREKTPHPRLDVRGPSPYGDRYARAVCALEINLHFLRKLNRDTETTRSIEIPACGAFMLAERTEDHLALFQEGREAEFFGSDDEMLEKVRFYLAHPAERQRIAAAGRERCLKSGYSYQARLTEMLDVIRTGAGAAG